MVCHLALGSGNCLECIVLFWVLHTNCVLKLVQQLDVMVIKGWSISCEYRLRELGFFNQRRESSRMCVQRSYWYIWAYILRIQEASFKYNYFTMRVVKLWNRNFGDGLSLTGRSSEQSVLVHPVVRGHAGRSLEVPSTLNVLWFSLLNCWCNSGPFNSWVL